MSLKIETGRKVLPPRIILYGVEGVGKSTFGATFPNPFFLCSEGGADLFDVQRASVSSVDELEELWNHLIQNLDSWDSLIIDSIDWLEYIIGKEIADKNGEKLLSNIKWNKGGTFLLQEMFEILTGPLDYFKSKGKFVVLLAHSEIESFTDPKLLESYDRFSIKSHKKTKALYKEWCDCLFFTDFETDVVSAKAVTTGKRIVWANHSPASDSKNRYSIPNGLELDINNFKKYFK